MKIHMFYFRDKNENRRLEPTLYAYTNIDEYARRFKEFRDMDKFLYTKRELTKDQYKDMVRSYPSYQLTKTRLVTKDKEFPTKKTHVDIICTWDEEKNVILESEDSVFQLFKDKVFDPSLFSMQMKTDLYKLGFFTIYQYLYQRMYIFEPLIGSEYDGVFNKDIGYEDMYQPVRNANVSADQLGMFMFLFGGTVRM